MIQSIFLLHSSFLLLLLVACCLFPSVYNFFDCNYAHEFVWIYNMLARRSWSLMEPDINYHKGKREREHKLKRKIVQGLTPLIEICDFVVYGMHPFYYIAAYSNELFSCSEDILIKLQSVLT